ncbi:PAS domain S-box-containing protein [Pseudoxanthobacter soli DSM 19599]|uniref:histidine kinase n=1 Tax=Pseudoxanthobacter soli DSM 19599 TaxID=1123029 RepID=A0A1M7ZCM4_9HYPH|nr:histidine kinase dimerization/phospho-acceptor domain-containing protein [Pseudoxanthobacter soli]SHO62648.1 PAS domain S-box-containing protein [Pseudoxanthobacter soli DSM 19599]
MAATIPADGTRESHLARFLALTAHPVVGGQAAERRMVFVLDQAATQILWYNAAAARFCEFTAGLSPAPSNPRASALLSAVGRHLAVRFLMQPGLVRLRVFVDFRPVGFLCRLQMLRLQGGEPALAVTVIEPASSGGEDEAASLAAFCPLVAGDGFALVVDAAGAIVAEAGAVEIAEVFGGRSAIAGLAASGGSPSGAALRRMLLGDTGLRLVIAAPAERPPAASAQAKGDATAQRPPAAATARPSAAADASTGAGDSGTSLSAVRTALSAGTPASIAQAAPALPRPRRFSWQTDSRGRFTFVSTELAEVVGQAQSAIVGHRWDEVAAAFGLDPDGRIASAFDLGQTWSGVRVLWPRADGWRVPVNLSALSVRDAGGAFRGFRGSGLALVALAEPSDVPFGSLAPETDDDAPTRPVADGTEAPAAAAEASGVPFAAEPEATERRAAETADEIVPGMAVEVPSEPAAASPNPVGDDGSSAARDDDTAQDDDGRDDDGFARDAIAGAVPSPITGTDAAEADDVEPDDREPDQVELDHVELDRAEADNGASDHVAQDVSVADEACAGGPEARPDDLPTAGGSDQPDFDEERPPWGDGGEPPSSLESADLFADERPGMDAVAGEGDGHAAGRLSRPEWEAFRQVAAALGARFAGDEDESAKPDAGPGAPTPADTPVAMPKPPEEPAAALEMSILDRLPVGLAICRDSDVPYANAAILNLLGYADREAFVAAGGFDTLFVEPSEADADSRLLRARRADGSDVPVDARMLAVPWGGARALLVVLQPARPARAVIAVRAPGATGEGEATAVAGVLPPVDAPDTEPPLAEAAATAASSTATSSGAPAEAESPAAEAPPAASLPVDRPEAAVAASDRSPPDVAPAAPVPVVTGSMFEAAKPATRTAGAVAQQPAPEPAGEADAVLDALPDAVVVVDRRCAVVTVNRAAERLFGRTRAALRGEAVGRLVSALGRGTLEAAIATMIDAVVPSNAIHDLEAVGRSGDGEDVPLMIGFGRFGEGLGARVCLTLRDVGVWKRTEAALAAATRVAEQASAQKSDFLARITHEIRTPLNAIIGFAEVMLEERLGPIGTPRYRDYLRDIRSSGGHILSLVNDLLDLAKIEAGRAELDLEPVALNAVVRECVGLMQPEAGSERVIIRTSLAGTLPTILADRRSIKQIVLNILSNAVKFNVEGGQVILSTSCDETGAVVFRCRDTGIGMSPEEVVVAMEPFRRLGGARRGGTGLGLPLTKALAEANGAGFALQSEPRRGTLVEIRFSTADAAAA